MNDKTHNTFSPLANSRLDIKVLQPFSQNHNSHKDFTRAKCIRFSKFAY
jgi:hypothetical protein